MSKVTTVNPDESIDVTVEDTTYSFRAPRGRDLSKMRKLMQDDTDEVEALAIVMSTLQKEGALTPDQWLDDVPLSVFKKVGEALSDSFQL